MITILLDATVMTIKFGSYSWIITTSQIVYWAIAALVGLVAEFIVGWRLPFGFVGAVVAALIGIWLLTNVIQVTIPGDITIAGVPIPIIKAFLGAILVMGLWHLVTYPLWHHRGRYYRRYSAD